MGMMDLTRRHRRRRRFEADNAERPDDGRSIVCPPIIILIALMRHGKDIAGIRPGGKKKNLLIAHAAEFRSDVWFRLSIWKCIIGDYILLIGLFLPGRLETINQASVFFYYRFSLNTTPSIKCGQSRKKYPKRNYVFILNLSQKISNIKKRKVISMDLRRLSTVFFFQIPGEFLVHSVTFL